MKISQILKAWLLGSVIFSTYQVLMFVYIVTIIIVFGARIMYDVCISVMSKVVSILHNFYWILGNIKDLKHITRMFWNFNHLPQKKFREDIRTIQCQNTILLDQLPNKVHSIYTLFGMVKRATKPFTVSPLLTVLFFFHVFICWTGFQTYRKTFCTPWGKTEMLLSKNTPKTEWNKAPQRWLMHL